MRKWFVPTTAATMTQFDVFVNPVRSARSTYPFVLAMQSDLAGSPGYQVVAPVATPGAFSAGGRLVPKVAIQGKDHWVLVPHMTVIPSRDLTTRIDSAAQARSELLAAVDLLFFGL